MFKRFPADTQFLFITLILVLLLGIPTFHTITDTDDDMSVDPVAQKVRAGENFRRPASIPGAPMRPEKSGVSQFTQYDVSCIKKSSPSFHIVGGYVQLRGKNCLKNIKEGDIEIINKSNGYTASIFLKGSDKYQTDLIQLQNGENEITIRYREHSGKAVEETLRVHSQQI